MDTSSSLSVPSQTQSKDCAELDAIKQQLSSFQLPQELQPLQQIISSLVWKLEAVLKEKNDLLITGNMRTAVGLGSTQPTTSESAHQNFETDEESLENEIGWATKRSKRRRKTQNQPGKRTDGGASKPPPIKVETSDVKAITNLAQVSSGEGKFTIKPLNQKVIKVNCEEEQGYRNLVSSLKQNNVSYYTYENKQTRPIRVVAKGLHSQWDEKEILDDLGAKGFKVTDVSKKLSARDKTPLNMFTLSFAPEEDIDSIYKIDKILYNVVQICPLKGNKLVPQCKNCQEFGHTRNHCNKKPRCVKCGKGHLTTQCPKERTVRPTCANCKKDHPANYRGCVIAKEAQLMRNQQRKATMQAKQPARKNLNPVLKPSQPVQANKSFADIVSAHAHTSQNNPLDTSSMLHLILNEVKSVKLTVSTLSQRVDTIERQTSSRTKSKTRK